MPSGYRPSIGAAGAWLGVALGAVAVGLETLAVDPGVADGLSVMGPGNRPITPTAATATTRSATIGDRTRRAGAIGAVRARAGRSGARRRSASAWRTSAENQPARRPSRSSRSAIAQLLPEAAHPLAELGSDGVLGSADRARDLGHRQSGHVM